MKLKEYLKSEFPDLDYIYDEIMEEEIGYSEEFLLHIIVQDIYAV